MSLRLKNKVRVLVLGVCSAPADVPWPASPYSMPYCPNGVEDRPRRYILIINTHTHTPSAAYLFGICPEISGLNIVNLDVLTQFSSIGGTLKMP